MHGSQNSQVDQYINIDLLSLCVLFFTFCWFYVHGNLWLMAITVHYGCLVSGGLCVYFT